MGAVSSNALEPPLGELSLVPEGSRKGAGGHLSAMALSEGGFPIQIVIELKNGRQKPAVGP
jgi:hypothetical protein